MKPKKLKTKKKEESPLRIVRVLPSVSLKEIKKEEKKLELVEELVFPESQEESKAVSIERTLPSSEDQPPRENINLEESLANVPTPTREENETIKYSMSSGNNYGVASGYGNANYGAGNSYEADSGESTALNQGPREPGAQFVNILENEELKRNRPGGQDLRDGYKVRLRDEEEEKKKKRSEY